MLVLRVRCLLWWWRLADWFLEAFFFACLKCGDCVDGFKRYHTWCADALVARALRKYSDLLLDAILAFPYLLLIVPHLLLPAWCQNSMDAYNSFGAGGAQFTQLDFWAPLPLLVYSYI